MSLADICDAADDLMDLIEGARAQKGRVVGPLAPGLMKLLRSRWKQQQAGILMDARQKLRDFASSTREATEDEKARRKRLLELAAAAILAGLVIGSAAEEEIAAFDLAVTTSYVAGAGTLAKLLKKAAVSLEPITPRSTAVGRYLADEGFAKLAVDIDRTTLDRLANAAADAYESGAGYDGVVQAIKDTFKDFSDRRAELIAKNELNDAYNAGRAETGRRIDDALASLGSEKRMGKYWDTDGEACEICLANEAEGVIPMDQQFSSGDDQPTAHPNCDCVIGFELA